MKRNLGWTTFGRTEEGTRRDYNDLIKRLEQPATLPVTDPTDSNSDSPDAEPQIVTPDPISIANIDPKKYVQVGMNGLHGNPVLISKYEIDGANEKNYEATHRFVLNRGLYVPTPAIFTTYFKRVVDAHNGNNPLYDGSGTEIKGKELDDLYFHLTKNHIASYSGGQEGAWTWLNAKFVNGSGFNGLNLETVVGITKSGLQTKKVPLEQCEWKDEYVNLKFNSQGLATTKSKNQKYGQGSNIYFWFPRENCVARFGAYSVRAGLDCLRDPSLSGSSLGVYACAEGATSQNSGGKK